MIVTRIEFLTAPDPGTVLIHKAQRFEVDAIIPHRCLDGRMTTLVRWRGYCATCGEPIETTTTLRAKGITRRCRDHRRRG